MNEATFKAVIAALENQRNSAFNALVNTEAALTLATQENQRLKSELAVFRATVSASAPTPEQEPSPA